MMMAIGVTDVVPETIAAIFAACVAALRSPL